MTRDRSKPPGKTRKSKAPSWVKRIHMALKQWHGPGTLSSPFADLYLYRTLARQPHITPRQATNQLLLAALNELEILYDEDAHLLRLRFLDGWPIQRLANHLNVAEGTAFANQRRAMERLADCLQEMERKASANQRATLKGRLEAQAYTNLIGVEEQIEHLLALWTQAEPPWIFAVEGIGGIGKTTLVGQWLDQAAHPAAWVSVDEDDNDLARFVTYLIAAYATNINLHVLRAFLRLARGRIDAPSRLCTGPSSYRPRQRHGMPMNAPM